MALLQHEALNLSINRTLKFPINSSVLEVRLQNVTETDTKGPFLEVKAALLTLLAAISLNETAVSSAAVRCFSQPSFQEKTSGFIVDTQTFRLQLSRNVWS